MASSELAAKLLRRNQLIEAAEVAELEQQQAQGQQKDVRVRRDSELSIPPGSPGPTSPPVVSPPYMPLLNVWNPYSEFKEFTRKQIQQYQKVFKQFDTSNDKFIDFTELKLLMEKIGAPQTHLALKAMIREVDEDHDNKISFREFLLIFRKAQAGELTAESGLYDLYRTMQEIDVEKEGVKGAKNFFEAKIVELTETSRFETEIRAEQEEKARLEVEKKQRKAAFKATTNIFQCKH